VAFAAGYAFEKVLQKNEKPFANEGFKRGGEGGIRTLEGIAPLAV
jgi:hypothetical protein